MLNSDTDTDDEFQEAPGRKHTCVCVCVRVCAFASALTVVNDESETYLKKEVQTLTQNTERFDFL